MKEKIEKKNNYKLATIPTKEIDRDRQRERERMKETTEESHTKIKNKEVKPHIQ